MPVALDDDARGWLDPAAVFAEAGVGADGAKDGRAGDGDGRDLLDHGVEDGTEVGFAGAGEAGGLGVSVEIDAMEQRVLADDFPGVEFVARAAGPLRAPGHRPTATANAVTLPRRGLLDRNNFPLVRPARAASGLTPFLKGCWPRSALPLFN